MASIENVVSNGMCVGCGACSVATNGAVSVSQNARGEFEARLDRAGRTQLQMAAKVCPIANESRNEAEIADEVFGPNPDRHPIIGESTSISAGRVGPQEDALTSSSGGMTSWVALELLERGKVDGVIHVGPGEDSLFAYTVSYTGEEIRDRRKSMYYSTSFAEALTSVRGDGKKYAFIGVPCFVRAARNLVAEVEGLDEQLVYFLGLVCGHLKSSSFAEALAWQAGVHPDKLSHVDFRVKNPSRNAVQYDFGAKSTESDELHTHPTPSLIGGNWGHGMFQLNACNYCDDIFAETADIAFGDAWLPEYEANWRGTNVVVNRNDVIQTILDEGQSEGHIQLEPLSAEQAVKSQAGNYRHRRVGLAVRLHDDIEEGRWVPTKRVKPGVEGVDERRLKIVRARRKLTDASHVLFAEAKKRDSLDYFLNEVDPLLKAYRKIDEKPFLIRTARKIAKRLLAPLIKK